MTNHHNTNSYRSIWYKRTRQEFNEDYDDINNQVTLVTSKSCMSTSNQSRNKSIRLTQLDRRFQSIVERPKILNLLHIMINVDVHSTSQE